MSFILGGVRVMKVFTGGVKALSMQEFQKKHPESVKQGGVKSSLWKNIKNNFPIVVNEYRGTLSIHRDTQPIVMIEMCVGIFSIIAHKTTDKDKKEKYVKALKCLKEAVFHVRQTGDVVGDAPLVRSKPKKKLPSQPETTEKKRVVVKRKV